MATTPKTPPKKPRGRSSSIRAAFADAIDSARDRLDLPDPPPEQARDDMPAGAWPGAPVDRLPANCPVIALGVDGKVSFFIDTLGQVLGYEGLDKKRIIQLFRTTPNFPYWAWPRWSAPKGQNARPGINGLEVDDAVACLEKAAGNRGLFDPAEKVRGRGAWCDRAGRLIWHSGDALWTLKDGGKLARSPPGEIDGIFYPRRPPVMEPWREPVSAADETSPAPDIFKNLTTWSFERGALDCAIALGAIGVMIIGGALRQRPHLAAMGDFGVGKSELIGMVKAIIGDALIDCANTTEAGVRQRLAFDTLPVGLDEFEASEDNRRVKAIVDLARYSYSGGRVLRGGADHHGVEFLARSAFFANGINLPPMGSADRSRFAILNLGKLDKDKIGDKPVIRDDDGRKILRALMDGWTELQVALAEWNARLEPAGLDSRACNTYGTLLAVAQILLGEELLTETLQDYARSIGKTLTDLGEIIAQATAFERALQVENWRACLEHLMAKPIDAWKGGEQASVGRLLEQLEQLEALGGNTPEDIKQTRARLAAAGLGLRELSAVDYAAIYAKLPEPRPAQPRPGKQFYYLLAVPVRSSALEPLFAGTRWQQGGWHPALLQAPKHVRRTDLQQTVKINRVPTWCVLIDLAAYDAIAGGEE